jgi:hypothetical protein
MVYCIIRFPFILPAYIPPQNLRYEIGSIFREAKFNLFTNIHVFDNVTQNCSAFTLSSGPSSISLDYLALNTKALRSTVKPDDTALQRKRLALSATPM